MNPDAATFWTGIACLVLGWVAFWVLVHRPAIRVRALVWAADGEEIKRLRTMLASAEADNTTYLRKIGEIATEKANLRIALDNERAEHGVRADSLDNPPDAVALADEFRRDFEGGDVVPMRGRS